MTGFLFEEELISDHHPYLTHDNIIYQAFNSHFHSPNPIKPSAFAKYTHLDSQLLFFPYFAHNLSIYFL